MLQIGITGGIGSGKSIVRKMFEQLGIPAYDADESAKRLMHQDEQLVRQIKSEFGEQIYNDDMQLNRKLLSSIIFKDKSALAKINSLVHPAVFHDYDQWVQSHRNAPYLIKESAILFEAKANSGLDYVITVTAPQPLRVERVMHRDDSSENEVLQIMEKQWPEEEKITHSDFIIQNDEKKPLLPQVMELHGKFISLSKTF